ncbi:uncharacterized protein LOC116256265 [Nymphaea colorata]|nr:uncharacterized protein LOC116256265 [Nymphaea colorata]
MASSSLSLRFSFLVALSLALHCAFGAIVCEDLPQDVCAFAISSAGKRCVLEKFVLGDGSTEFQCRTSEVVVEKMTEWIETDECVRLCGVDRNSVGISSDSLMEPQFTAKLCSAECYGNCPNIVDLYFNLAAGEGVFLPELCEIQRTNPRRGMAELLSSGVVAPAPESDASPLAAAPASI